VHGVGRLTIPSACNAESPRHCPRLSVIAWRPSGGGDDDYDDGAVLVLSCPMSAQSSANSYAHAGCESRPLRHAGVRDDAAAIGRRQTRARRRRRAFRGHLIWTARAAILTLDRTATAALRSRRRCMAPHPSPLITARVNRLVDGRPTDCRGSAAEERSMALV
jgi:hypothetical protein